MRITCANCGNKVSVTGRCRTCVKREKEAELAHARRERDLARQSAEDMRKELDFVRDRQIKYIAFAQRIARMNWDGEERPDGSFADVSNDDNHDTVISLIEEARQLVGV